ncbi:hypothetical protein FB192DRAFT_1374602 [Mucor lusitanicus]|uniref:Uncharacterized protein n=1 Tax=Mucor circinelloides f. lusitanicus TaxID=29924 RepID=A0A8H4BGC4_MUCCL|nr:hypothetical protein FB192DRAFT_1374602 [Mucor lusitanicus]
MIYVKAISCQLLCCYQTSTAIDLCAESLCCCFYQRKHRVNCIFCFTARFSFICYYFTVFIIDLAGLINYGPPNVSYPDVRATCHIEYSKDH